MMTEPKVGDRVQLSDMARCFPDEYVFATAVDNNHPDYPDNFWLLYAGHCRFEEREQMRNDLENRGFRAHWYRTTPNRNFTSVGWIGSL